MRLMLHTFRKDIRHLWPAALVTWVMLFTVARVDRWRADWIPSPLESWMNMLLTMAWACLATLAVLEEPLAGDRNFWTTRPQRWPSLLGAKLLFVGLAIHLPSFLADVYILASRGFSPAAHLPDLLWKQLLLFGAVTLPSIALASLVRSFTHFVIVAFTIATGILILNGGFQNFPEFTPQQNELRHAVVRILLAAAALAVIWIQYARRRAIPARVIAIAAAVAAASLATWLPARAEYSVGAVPESPRISLRNAPLNDDVIHRAGGMQATVLLPIAIDSSARFHIPLIDLEIVAPDGTRLQSIRPSPNRPAGKIDLSVYLMSAANGGPPASLTLSFSRSAWEHVKDGRVHVRGAAAFDFYRLGQTTILPTQGTGSVPDLGRCTALTSEERFSNSALKVLCESPRELPAATITLRHESSGREWKLGLRSSITYSPGPHEIWLSPLHRGQSFFQLINGDASAPGEQWLVPAMLVPEARLEITPEIPTGHALAHFDFGDVTLSSWLVTPRIR